MTKTPSPKRLLLITDACPPQVNGVIRSTEHLVKTLKKRGIKVHVLDPDDAVFKMMVLPKDNIEMAIPINNPLHRLLKEFKPDAIHILTEGPMGFLGNYYCRIANIPFTTSYHTMWPEFLKIRYHLPTRIAYATLKHFHKPSQCVMIPTQAMKEALEKRKKPLHPNIKVVPNGIDTEFFKPLPKKDIPHKWPKPVLLHVGRIAKEKNIEEFLNIKAPGTKVVVGQGPHLKTLQKKYPEAIFVGEKTHKELVSYFSAADIFVFPSKSDTFGMVILEALSCDLPVVAHSIGGPKSILTKCKGGILTKNLETGVKKALALKNPGCRKYAKENYDLEVIADLFIQNLKPIDPEKFNKPPKLKLLRKYTSAITKRFFLKPFLRERRKK